MLTFKIILKKEVSHIAFLDSVCIIQHQITIYPQGAFYGGYKQFGDGKNL